MKIKEFTDHLETLAPLQWQEPYDNAGLIIGSPDDEVTGVLLCLDVTEDVLDEAEKKNCNLIISHHPVIFSGLKRLTGSDLTQKLVIKAIRGKQAIYAIHTNLDNSFDGLNALLLHKLGVKNCRILSPRENELKKLVTFAPVEFAEKVRLALFDSGAGQIGNYDCCSYNLEGFGTFRALSQAKPFVGELNKLHEEREVRIEVVFPGYLQQELVKSLLRVHPYEEVAYDVYPLANSFPLAGAGMIGELEEVMAVPQFLQRVKNATGIPFIRHTAKGHEKVRSIALCTGSGSFLIEEARRASADIFLTSDLKYHDFFLPNDAMLLADIGHYESEQFVKEWIYNALIEKFPTFAIFISETNTNPINYF